MRTSFTSLVIVLLAIAGAAHAAAPIKAGALDTQTQANAVAEALQSVVKVQGAVADYRKTHDGFPANNAEAGVAAPVMYASNAVKGVAVGPDGIIDVTLTAASGVQPQMKRATAM